MHLKSHANTSTKNNLLVIIAHSARALAESAWRAGYQVITIDGFSDVDTLKASLESWCLPLVNGEFSADKVETCLKKVHKRYPIAKVIAGAGAELYLPNLEAKSGWQILGNSSECVRQICEPVSLFVALDHLSIPYPEISYDSRPTDNKKWLYKTPFHCGGMGVSKKYKSNSSGYWQEELEGIPISALCLCAGEQSQLIGINRQFTYAISERLPYVYAGALANYEISLKSTEIINSYVGNLSSYFNLNGLCSIDMLLYGDGIFVLEINPRVSATFELYERLQPMLNLIDAHIRVCEGERLSSLESTSKQGAYSIVYAEGPCDVPELEWPDWVSDIPETGRQLHKYDPICTVHALLGETEDLYKMTQKRARQILSIIKQ